MKVYHGSYTQIDKIDLSKCEIGKDFGQGFYVTKLRAQAEFWARRKGLRFGTEGFVTEFDFNENAFTYFHLKILRFSSYHEEWLDFVAKNRDPRAPQPAHDYDLVEGPVADDRISQRINVYLKGDITKQQFLEELKFTKESHQICFCTARSLQMLDYIENPKDISFEIAEISEPIVEKLMSDDQIDEVKATDLFFNSTTFAQLEDAATHLYQKPWQEIYEMLKSEPGFLQDF